MSNVRHFAALRVADRAVPNVRAMSKLRASQLLRALSYSTLLLAAGWLVFDSGRNPAPACQSMACIGTGLGRAIKFLAALCGVLLLGTLLNSVSFLLHGPPRSVPRKLELWLVFVAPLLLLLGFAMSFLL